MFSARGLRKGSQLSWPSFRPPPWERRATQPPSRPSLGRCWMMQGLLYPEERKPGSGQAPPARQAVLPALFSFSLSQGRHVGGAFPQEEKTPGLLIPQSRGSSGPEAPGCNSTVIPRDTGLCLEGPRSASASRRKGKQTLLLQNRLRSEGQQPVLGAHCRRCQCSHPTLQKRGPGWCFHQLRRQ